MVLAKEAMQLGQNQSLKPKMIKGEREWKLRSTTPEIKTIEDRVKALQKDIALSSLTLKVCLNRGLNSAEEIRSFLSPKLENLKNPFSIRDMDLATDRMVKARKDGEQVLVFGDYDVDGTTGASLLTWVLREFEFKSEARQPDRFKDGYGLNVKAVEDAQTAGFSVLITVDCGITSFAAAKRAHELGIDLIILDHHQVDPLKGLPEAFAVVNPQRKDCESGLKELCGCGLAFYFSRALRSKGKKENWWEGRLEPNLKQHLDLVVMATAADMVPLTGDNHILVRYGLEVLNYSKKPGVKALLEVSGIGKRNLSPSHLGFILGPRINASGRMAQASLSFELLTTQDPTRAYTLAQEIEKLNQERALVQNKIWDEVKIKVEEGLKAGKYQHGIVVADERWHEGVVGIVASRVVEIFQKPTVVIAIREGVGKGSVRSSQGKDVLQALQRCSGLLLGFGGHRHAAGLSLSQHQVELFTDTFNEVLGQVPEDENLRPLLIEGECEVCDLDRKTLQELEKLGPFGPGNPEPVFKVRGLASQHRILKERHLKFKLTSSASSIGAQAPNCIEALWFHGVDHIEGIRNLQGEWAGVPELNRYRGNVTPTLRIKDYRDGLTGGSV